MNFLKNRLLITILILGTTFGAKAEEFSDCLKHGSKKGYIVLVVDDTKFNTTAEAFELLDSLRFIGFKVHSIETHANYIYNSDWTWQLGSDGKPLTTDRTQKISAKIDGYNISYFVDQNGMINQDLAEEFDGKIDALKKSFPAIIRTECPLVPGPGGRVGG